jgi:hypothetical protein
VFSQENDPEQAHDERRKVEQQIDRRGWQIRQAEELRALGQRIKNDAKPCQLYPILSRERSDRGPVCWAKDNKWHETQECQYVTQAGKGQGGQVGAQAKFDKHP